jgi:hypothetical protein
MPNPQLGKSPGAMSNLYPRTEVKPLVAQALLPVRVRRTGSAFRGIGEISRTIQSRLFPNSRLFAWNSDGILNAAPQ